MWLSETSEGQANWQHLKNKMSCHTEAASSGSAEGGIRIVRRLPSDDASSDDFLAMPRKQVTLGRPISSPIAPGRSESRVSSPQTVSSKASATDSVWSGCSEVKGKSAKEKQQKSKAKAKATAKVKTFMTAASRQKASREVAACQKNNAAMEMIAIHVASKDHALATTAGEVSAVISNAEKRLHPDVRWIYLGEDVSPDDEPAIIESRVKTLEETKSLNRTMVWILPVIRCSAATVSKDTAWFDTELFRDKLDDCLTNTVPVGTPLVLRYIARKSMRALGLIIDDFGANVLRLSSNAYNSRTVPDVPALSFKAWADMLTSTGDGFAYAQKHSSSDITQYLGDEQLSTMLEQIKEACMQSFEFEVPGTDEEMDDDADAQDPRRGMEIREPWPAEPADASDCNKEEALASLEEFSRRCKNAYATKLYEGVVGIVLYAEVKTKLGAVFDCWETMINADKYPIADVTAASTTFASNGFSWLELFIGTRPTQHTQHLPYHRTVMPTNFDIRVL